MTMGPTPEQRARVILLRETTGLSFSEIGRLTGLSKGSARGVAARAGLSNPANNPVNNPVKRAGVTVSVARLPNGVRGLPADTASRPGQAKRLCQWIFGEPKPGQRWIDMDKCSDPALFGGSYCELHAGRATQPGKPRPL